MATTQPKKIRALVGLGKLSEGTIKDLLAGSLKGLTENAAVFPKPPIALADYQAAIDAYEASIPASSRRKQNRRRAQEQAAPGGGANLR